MSLIVGLTGQYVQVKRKKTGEITYGGDQGFFAGGPARSIDARKQKQGCGITALADIFLYLAGRDRNYIIEENNGCIDRVLSEEEYKRYYNRIYEFAGGIAAWGNNGLTFVRVQNRFNRMVRREHWHLRARWGFSAGKLYNRISEMLERDIPVVLCVPFMVRKRDKGRGTTFYIRRENELIKAASVSAHYVVVTGIIKEKECVYLEISSWGKKYYIDWMEYDMLIRTCFLGAILGNILYVRHRG